MLDVRKKQEFEEQHIVDAQWIYLGELPNQLGKLDVNKPVTVMCESGARATVGASVLMAAGFNQVDVFLGAMGAWRKHHA